jgi:hypothetical protein
MPIPTKPPVYDGMIAPSVARSSGGKAEITVIELQTWVANDRSVKVSVGCLWVRISHLG